MAGKAASVLAKLRNKAKASGISYQQCLQLFVQEEFLRKLSKSGYGDTLILKGGLFIYALTNFESRATIDVDFLLRGYPNSIEDIKDLIGKIIDTPTGNDYIEMRAKGFEEISPQRKYHGISTQIIAQIKNVRVPFNIDIGVGDIIFPRAEERTINTQLPDFETPIIKTYSLESTIAEKFDAILQRFELTGRIIRDTMREIEEFARFRFLKYTTCYLDVLKYYLVSADNVEAVKQIPEISLWLEFGASKATQISLMSMGFTRTAALELSELMVSDDYDKAKCMNWFSKNDVHSMDIPPTILQEVDKVLSLQ